MAVVAAVVRVDDADPAYVKGSEFLKSIGFTNQAEIARVLDIAMNPNSLFVTFRDRKRAVNANVRQHRVFMGLFRARWIPIELMQSLLSQAHNRPPG